MIYAISRHLSVAEGQIGYVYMHMLHLPANGRRWSLQEAVCSFT